MTLYRSALIPFDDIRIAAFGVRNSSSILSNDASFDSISSIERVGY